MNASATAAEVLGRYGVLLPVLACVACAALLVMLQPILARYALAMPNARSSHHLPTPQGGGIGVLAATVGATLVLAAVFQDVVLISNVATIFAAAALIAMLGAIDDIRTIAIAPRLIVQALAVAAVLATLPADVRAMPELPLLLERVLLLICGLWFVNLVNFMDGLDWMTVAEVVPVTLGLVIIGALGGLPPHGMVAALALGGAMIGFAPFNRPVARLFLGDVGSLPIGLILGWLLLLVASTGHAAAAIILPLYYLADASLTLGRRIANGEPFWHAHRTHFYQRATDNGLTVMQVAARVFAVNLALVALATASVAMPSNAVILAALAAAAAIVALLLWSFLRGRTA